MEFEAVIGTKITREFSYVDLAIYLELPSRKIYEKCKANNPSRKETYDEAVARGEKIRAVWKCHRNFHSIGNEGGWDAKVDRVRQLIKSVIKT